MGALPTKVLVANRGEIACRVLHTLRAMGIDSVSVFTDPDAQHPHRHLADQAVPLGEPRAYMDSDAILAAAKETGADAIHPGYGFLSENPVLSAACKEAGILFIGPDAKAIERFGDKEEAREAAIEAGVPVIPGASQCASLEDARKATEKVGLPVLLKAAAGGGGKGMRPVFKAEDFDNAFESASREAENAFGNGRLLVEKYIHPARHIEVQILSAPGRAVAVGDRECSLQRRYQKIIEESPAASITQKTREALYGYAESLLSKASYVGAATVEFLVGPQQDIYFLEVNTRLQVEHPITEATSGLDLVEWQLRVSAGETPPERPTHRGHALEARINAEDAYGGFLPQTGPLHFIEWPAAPWCRIDTGVRQGNEVGPDYDSMIAKLIVVGADRAQAVERLRAALDDTHILGVTTNLPFLRELAASDFFEAGETFTHTVEAQTWEAAEIPEWAALVAAQTSGSASQAPSGRAAATIDPWPSLSGFSMGRYP